MANWAGCQVRRLETVDSTNSAARLWLAQGAPHGATVVARQQTAGRGRLGRRWESADGAGLYLSMVLRPEMPTHAFATLTFAAALAASDACGAVCDETPGIKWPNDLVLKGRKIAGILLERVGDAAICGIGINLRGAPETFPPELRATAGSLEYLTGVSVDAAALERALLAALQARVDDPDWRTPYTARSVTLGQPVRVLAPDGEFTGVAESLDEGGALLVRDGAGALRRVLAGDVSVRGLMGYV